MHTDTHLVYHLVRSQCTETQTHKLANYTWNYMPLLKCWKTRRLRKKKKKI